MTTWFGTDNEERLLAAWADAPIERSETCAMVLEVAREQVLDYAPAGAPAEQVVNLLTSLGYPTDTIAAVNAVLEGVITDPPTRYVYAQIQQAQNLWNAGRVSTGGDFGEGQFTFTPRPLDKTIRQIIRPVDGKPDVY